MSERIFGGVLVLISLVGLFIARGFEAPFSYEPVGPKAFPMIVLALLGGVVFLTLTSVQFAKTGVFDMVTFAGAWASLLGATALAIYGRTRSDRIQREDVALMPDVPVVP